MGGFFTSGESADSRLLTGLILLYDNLDITTYLTSGEILNQVDINENP